MCNILAMLHCKNFPSSEGYIKVYTVVTPCNPLYYLALYIFM
nr:MAG TPA: hypothetical protein [Caudoviricetes sp.]